MMIKKFFIICFIVGTIVLTANYTNAEECFIREDLLQFNSQNVKVTTPVQEENNNTCPISNTSECTQQNTAPATEVNQNNETATTDYATEFSKFITKANCAVGLNDTQRVQATELKDKVISQINEIVQTNEEVQTTKDITKIISKAKKDYEKILTPEQKKLYKDYKMGKDIKCHCPKPCQCECDCCSHEE